MSGDRLYNAWIEKSLARLAQLMPGRYAKAEISSGFLGSIDRYAYRSPAAACCRRGSDYGGRCSTEWRHQCDPPLIICCSCWRSRSPRARARRPSPPPRAAKRSVGATVAKAAKPVPPLRADIQQDEGGFTIVEEVRVGNDIHADYDNAMRLFEQKQYEQGIASLLKVTQAAPNVTAAHIDLGIAYARIGDLDKAEASLQRALELNPRHPIAHNELGMVQRRKGQFDAARASYEKALALSPDISFRPPQSRDPLRPVSRRPLVRDRQLRGVSAQRAGRSGSREVARRSAEPRGGEVGGVMVRMAMLCGSRCSAAGAGNGRRRAEKAGARRRRPTKADKVAEAKTLSGISILGNQEAPKSLVIVPWKGSEIGDMPGLSRLLDDSVQPVDKDVFMRELSYYEIRSGKN